jgi:capsule polysaccharide export protein KpsE/RkpR
MANAFVDELRKLSATLAITEAQQRREFFEAQLGRTRDRLTAAQVALQSSGFGAGALKAEPRAAAEAYARLRAEATAAEVRLQGLRGSLVDGAPEIVQQLALLSALRAQLARAEAVNENQGGTDYIGKYREFKYQETLFELFARQYELARVDEAREGSLFQVIDAALPPQKKSRPRRALTAVAATIFAGALLVAWVLGRQGWRRMAAGPRGAERIDRLRRALRGH